MAALVASAVLQWLLPMLALLLLLPALVYQYVNWVNDVYILTAYRIIDIVRNPPDQGKTAARRCWSRFRTSTVNVPNFSSKLLDMGDVFVETAGQGRKFPVQDG